MGNKMAKLIEKKKIDVTGTSLATVLATLYNQARPQGMGYLEYDATPMTEEEAFKVLKASLERQMGYSNRPLTETYQECPPVDEGVSTSAEQLCTTKTRDVVRIETLPTLCESVYSGCLVDYLNGRVVKAHLGNTIALDLYLRDNTHVTIDNMVDYLSGAEEQPAEAPTAPFQPRNEVEYQSHYLKMYAQLLELVATSTGNITPAFLAYDISQLCIDHNDIPTFGPSVGFARELGLNAWEADNANAVDILCSVVSAYNEYAPRDEL